MSAERLQQIELMLKKRHHMTVAELSTYLGVSEPTIRRDLQKLQATGRVLREHGKTMAVEPARLEPPIILRMMEHSEEKRKIGRATAQLINDGETIFLGGGTTTMEVARHLEGKKNLTVITNTLTTAQVLSTNTAVNVIMTGGVLRHSELSFIGHFVNHTLRELRGDKVILSMLAVSIEGGLTNAEPLETATVREIMQFAREIILVVDHTKFNRVTTSFVAPITAVQTIVTDDQTSPEIIKHLQALGIKVVVA